MLEIEGNIKAANIDEEVYVRLNNHIDAAVEEKVGDSAAATTEAWLTEHVTPVGSAVVVDDSLTISGAAADAQVTGSRVDNAITSVEHFPFAEVPSNVQTYALRNLKIISSAYSELYVHRIIRGGSGGGSYVVHAIILRNENGSDIKLLNVLTGEYTEVSPETPVYFEDNGVSGYYNIDWTKVTYGTMAVNSNNANKGAKINSLAMPSHSVTDSTLTKQYVAADAKAVGDELKTMQKEITGDGFVIPDVIYGVVGYPFSIYYYNIFQIDSLDGYHVELQGASAKYKNYGDRVRFSCDEVAGYTITINIRKNNNVDIVSKTITVNILPNTQHTVKAIFIGDSFIWDGKMVAQIKTLMGNSMTLYGTVQKAALNSNDESVQISCEGRSGWSLYDYVNLSQKSGVTNVFWDGEKFNFSYYITQNPSYADVTDVFILSGPNDNGATPENYAIRYNQIIASIKAYSAAIKIHCFMPLTCNCDGYAWGARNYNGASKYRYNMISYAKKVMEIAADDSGVSAVPMHINFDRHYNFPLTQVAVNDRTPTLITVFGDNVHPNNYGYYCMADVIYADIIATAEV